MCQLKYKPNVDMELLRILFVHTLIASMEAQPTGTSHEGIKHAVSNGLPWVNPPDYKVPCATNLCQEFQKLCKNGGQCEMTLECGAMCRCLKQYTGPFCGVEVKDSVTNGKIELLRTKTPESNMKSNTTTATILSTYASGTSSYLSGNTSGKGINESFLQSTTSENLTYSQTSSSTKPVGMLQITDYTTVVPEKQNRATLPVKDIITESGAVSVNSTRIVPDKNFKIEKNG